MLLGLVYVELLSHLCRRRAAP